MVRPSTRNDPDPDVQTASSWASGEITCINTKSANIPLPVPYPGCPGRVARSRTAT